ncbi:MAG: sporulation protein YqfD [Bacilli bacterium]|nr:sporulation protein YqfD [Bacilli bacterium]
MNKVKICVYSDSYKFINYLIYNKINYNSLCKNKDSFILVVDYEDYKRIRLRYKCNIIKYYGKNGIKNFIMINKYMIISVIISLLVLKLLTMTIFDIKINTSDGELKSKIMVSLSDNGISKYKRKKSFNELLIIKDKILESNKDDLEWIEINEHGCVYEINLTKRVKKKEIKEEYKESSIYASMDGVIKKIVVYSGTKKKDVNDYVKKGEVLISGNIYKNDEVVGVGNAKGEVYAETWYYVTASIPFEYEEKVFTGRIINHYYLDIFGNKFTLIGKYSSDNTENNIKLILDKSYLPFKLYRESKKVYQNKKHTINRDEAYEMGLKLSDLRINNMLDDDEYIISKKVLKKEANSSKMNIEVFYKVYKNIGYTSNIDKEEKEKANGSSN